MTIIINGSNTPTAGAVAVGDGTTLNFTAAGTAGQILQSNGASVPTWINNDAGTVTSASVVSANGFAGTVANASTTPAITLSTSITGVLKGNGTALSAATAGTDYLAPPSGTAILKANSGGALANATAGTDYLAPPSGTALLKANSGGALANATAGTDYCAATSGSGILKGSSGNTTTATAGTDYVAPDTATTFTGTQTFNGTTSTLASVLVNAAEKATVVSSAPTSTNDFYVTQQSVVYFTGNATNNWVINIVGNNAVTLNSVLSTGQSITVAFLVTNGGTAYYNTSVQIDGTTSGVTTKWQGGTAPTQGNASAIDVYVYTVIKTASATYTVLASQTKFA